MTPVHYQQLQELYEKYQDRGFVVIGFPCNQFGKQEPGTAEEIKRFAAEKGATFPLMAKVDVNGKNAAPVWQFLRKEIGGALGSTIKWNFTKFLCDRSGKPVKRYGPPTKPNSFEDAIVKELEKEAPALHSHPDVSTDSNSPAPASQWKFAHGPDTEHLRFQDTDEGGH